jgi:hypothetical protein
VWLLRSDTEFLAPGEPATRAKELAFTALRLKQLSRA